MSDLGDLAAFLTVAETLSFRLAAERLGVTRPAVSLAVRRLEDSLGVALFRRTTRSVGLTEEGARLRNRVAPGFADIAEGLAAARDRDAAPRGRLRLAVSSIADAFLAGPLFASFVDAHPGMRLDVTVTDEEFDIVAMGYDAGVRLGEVIAQDMIAVPVSADQRQLVVAAPAYLDRWGTPRHPRELTGHRCIGWRPAPDVAPYRWEFEEDGRELDVALDLHVATNDMGVMLRVALAGGGITCGMAETFAPYVADGRLVELLDPFCPPFPGFFLYFPDRHNQPPRLRAFLDHVRDWRRSLGAGG